MDDVESLNTMLDNMKDRLAATVASQGPRLHAFVRRRVEDRSEVDDIVQDVFAELIAAYRLMQPVEHVTAWLLRVARNRIIDRFRARARESAVIDRGAPQVLDGAAESGRVVEEWLGPPADGPEAAYARSMLADELAAALDELPKAQRDVFIAHEIEGRSFNELAAATGVGLNTLLGRKHAAVRHLRRRLQDIRSEFDV